MRGLSAQIKGSSSLHSVPYILSDTCTEKRKNARRSISSPLSFFAISSSLLHDLENAKKMFAGDSLFPDLGTKEDLCPSCSGKMLASWRNRRGRLNYPRFPSLENAKKIHMAAARSADVCSAPEEHIEDSGRGIAMRRKTRTTTMFSYVHDYKRTKMYSKTKR